MHGCDMMNERLRELAKPALEYLNDGKSDAMNEQMLANFAEQIVKECIAALDKEVYIATREDGEQACHEVILLEHFDIE